MFWDMCVLTGYLILNLLVGWVGIECEKNGVEPPKWIKNLVYFSAIWAFSIHTVTAFLYAGLPGCHYWLTAILAARLWSALYNPFGQLLQNAIFSEKIIRLLVVGK
jgi:molybdopterin-containing oxidoreductase family membrane subunit